MSRFSLKQKATTQNKTSETNYMVKHIIVLSYLGILILQVYYYLCLIAQKPLPITDKGLHSVEQI